MGPESAYALPSGLANEPFISTERAGLSNQTTLYKSQIMPNMSHMNPCEPLNPHIPIASPFLPQWHPKKALDSALRDIRAKFAAPKSQNTPSPDIFDPKYSKILQIDPKYLIQTHVHFVFAPERWLPAVLNACLPLSLTPIQQGRARTWAHDKMLGQMWRHRLRLRPSLDAA